MATVAKQRPPRRVSGYWPNLALSLKVSHPLYLCLFDSFSRADHEDMCMCMVQINSDEVTCDCHSRSRRASDYSHRSQPQSLGTPLLSSFRPGFCAILIDILLFHHTGCSHF